MTVRPGTVYLVGAGPGDASLITVRGMELLQRADVVLHDRLVGEALLDGIPDRVARVDVGKSALGDALSQGAINAALIAHARAGRVVVRLKGGDPLVFGRGWEERAACLAAGVPCEIIPGITSAIAGPAAADVPVTCRGVASSFAVFAAPTLTRAQLTAAVHVDTAVFLMGVRGLRMLAAQLIAAGRDGSTPVAVIERATLPGQRQVHAVLDTIADVAADARMQAPSIIVVGATAALGATSLGPLRGRRLVVTRPRNAAGALVQQLTALGAEVIVAPGIAIVPRTVDDPTLLARMPYYDAIVFSSRHGVRGFRRALERQGGDARSLAHARIAAVGPVTARELEAWGVRADLVPTPARADTLVDTLLAQAPRVWRVLFPCGTLALDTIPDGLSAHGVVVDRLVVYDTRTVSPDVHTRAQIERGVDAVVFASPSAVRAFGDARIDIGDATVVCIGPTTAAATRAFGWPTVHVADVHTDAGLIATTTALLTATVDAGAA